MNHFFQGLAQSFNNNLIAGDAYLIVLKGLWVTILISAAGLLFGTIVGGVLCFFRMSKIGFIKKTAQIFIAVLRGSPVLLLLMILYYVAFANSRIDAVFIAIIAFALNSGSHIAEIMRSSL